MGALMTVGVVGGTIGAFASGSDDTALVIGAVIVGATILTGPIVAAGASSARDHPEVTGLLGLRISSWIGYGIGAALGIAAVIAAAVGETVTTEIAVSIVALDIVTLLGFTIDAFVSASEAESVASYGGGGVSPYMSAWRDPHGGWGPMGGVNVAF